MAKHEKSHEDNDSESVTDLSNISESSSDATDSSSVHSETISTDESVRNANRGRNHSSVYRNNPYFMNQSSYFQQSIIEQFSSKNKIVSFIEKDIFILNHYETGIFSNTTHAVEVMSPYHIYNKMVDDLKYEGSNIDVDLENIFNLVENKVADFANKTFLNSEDSNAFSSQLLLFLEQRRIMANLDPSKLKTATKIQKQPFQQKTVKKEKKPEKTIKRSKVVKKKRSLKDKFILLFKKPRYGYCYGTPCKIHFKRKTYE